jgi:hypothetical protein
MLLPTESLPPALLLPCCPQVVFVAATKVDLPGGKVSEAEGRAWALAHNMPYYEVSRQ